MLRRSFSVTSEVGAYRNEMSGLAARGYSRQKADSVDRALRLVNCKFKEVGQVQRLSVQSRTGRRNRRRRRLTDAYRGYGVELDDRRVPA